MTHIALLGDSIFDNGSYVPPDRDVISHLKRKLGPNSQASLLARDGAIVDEMFVQVSQIPSDATHLALSAGGNDALQNLGVLTAPSSTIAEALFLLSSVREAFSKSFSKLVEELLSLRLPLTICTIYHPPLFEEEAQPVVAAALSMFNDTIVSQAFRQKLSVIDTRLICHQESDFENVIEPSDIGGEKIADALAESVTNSPDLSRSYIYAG